MRYSYSLWQSKHDKTIKQRYCECKSPKVKLPKYQGCKGSTKLSNSNIASAIVQRSNYQECKRSVILQVQKSKGQTTQNIKSAKGRKPNIAGALDLCHFCTCNIWFSTFCILAIYFILRLSSFTIIIPWQSGNH